MTVLKRGDVAAPVLPKETIAVQALDGEVVVRGLLLTERLGIQKQIADLRKSGGDDVASVHAILPVVLAACVLDGDGLPLFTQEQWQTFGVAHADHAVTLFTTAWRLSGFAGDQDAKN